MAENKTVLTGASGLVGDAILRRLIKASHPVLVLDRDPSRLPIKDIPHVRAVRFQLGDIIPQIAKIITGFAPHTVIHAAWIGTENTNRNSPEFISANIEASRELLSLAARSGCKQWIGFGSQAEYGPDIQADLSENMPAVPESPYGKAKLAVCNASQALCAESGINFTWLRLFTCYGKASKPTYVIPYLIDTLCRGEMPTLKTPHAVWDCLHADDAADAVMLLLARSSAKGIYNLSSGKGVSVGEIALLLAELLNFKDIQELRKQIVTNHTPATHRVADMTKFTGDFGWTPKIDIRSGLLKCL